MSFSIAIRRSYPNSIDEDNSLATSSSLLTNSSPLLANSSPLLADAISLLANSLLANSSPLLADPILVAPVSINCVIRCALIVSLWVSDKYFCKSTTVICNVNFKSNIGIHWNGEGAGSPLGVLVVIDEIFSLSVCVIIAISFLTSLFEHKLEFRPHKV